MAKPSASRPSHTKRDPNHHRRLGIPEGIPGPGRYIPVICMPDDALGLTIIDGEQGKAVCIALRPGRTKCETHETLLHEILHVIERQAIAAKVLTKPLSEDVIDFFAGGLLVSLAGSDLHGTVSRREIKDHIRRVQARFKKGKS